MPELISNKQTSAREHRGRGERDHGEGEGSGSNTFQRDRCRSLSTRPTLDGDLKIAGQDPGPEADGAGAGEITSGSDAAGDRPSLFPRRDELRFFPLSEYSGRATTGDFIANEAREELFKIVAAMRGPHGPKLKDIRGPVMYGTEDDPREAEGERLRHIASRVLCYANSWGLV